MGVDLNAKAALLDRAEVITGEITLREAVAAALALSEERFEGASIMVAKMRPLVPADILAIAEEHDIEADDRWLG